MLKSLSAGVGVDSGVGVDFLGHSGSLTRFENQQNSHVVQRDKTLELSVSGISNVLELVLLFFTFDFEQKHMF